MSMKIGHAITMESHEDGSEEWHNQRSRGIGGSDAATILGLNPYGQTRDSLYRQKIGMEAGFQGNAATRFGSKIEPFVFSKASMEIEAGSLVQVKQSLQHPAHPWMLANIDGGWCHQGSVRGIAEIKTSSTPPPADGVHPYHYAQIQHYLGVTGLDVAFYIYLTIPMDRQTILDIEALFVEPERKREFWSWIVDQCEMVVRDVARDEAFIENLMDAEAKFWDCVTRETAPPEYLPEGEVRIEDPDLQELMAQLAYVQAEKPATPKSVTDREKTLKEKIKTYASAVSAAHDDAKKIFVGDQGDYVLWNARGYWVAKPADRQPETEADEDGFVMPF